MILLVSMRVDDRVQFMIENVIIESTIPKDLLNEPQGLSPTDMYHRVDDTNHDVYEYHSPSFSGALLGMSSASASCYLI